MSEWLFKSQELLHPQMERGAQAQGAAEMQMGRDAGQAIGSALETIGERRWQDKNREDEQAFRAKMAAREEAFRRGMFDEEMGFRQEEAGRRQEHLDRNYELAKEQQAFTQTATAMQIAMQKRDLDERSLQRIVNFSLKHQSLQEFLRKSQMIGGTQDIQAREQAIEQAKLANASTLLQIFQQARQLGIDNIPGLGPVPPQEPVDLYGPPAAAGGSGGPYGKLGMLVGRDSKGFYLLDRRMKGRNYLKPESAAKLMSQLARNEQYAAYNQFMEQAGKRMGLLEQEIKGYGDELNWDDATRGHVEKRRAEMRGINDLISRFGQMESGLGQEQGPSPGLTPMQQWAQGLERQKAEMRRLRGVYGEFKQVAEDRRHAGHPEISALIKSVESSPASKLKRVLELKEGQDLEGLITAELIGRRAEGVPEGQIIFETLRGIASQLGKDVTLPLEEKGVRTFEFKLGESDKMGKVPFPKEWSDRKIDLFHRWFDAFMEGMVKPPQRSASPPSATKHGFSYSSKHEMAFGSKTSDEGVIPFNKEFWDILSKAKAQYKAEEWSQIIDPMAAWDRLVSPGGKKKKKSKNNKALDLLDEQLKAVGK